MATKLERIAEISVNTRKPEFTSLYHHINAEMLKKCHRELDGNKAVGIDKVSKAEYEVNLEENISNLVKRLKDLVPCIRKALLKADTEIYKNSMQALVYKDIRSALQKIK